MAFNQPVLDLDPTGTNIDNKIIDEPHTLSGRPVRSIAPNYGPFFAESVIVRDGSKTLQRGLDYQIVELHQEATLKYGKEISSVILIINSEVSSSVTVTYQALGGHYTYSDYAIANMYQSVINDNRPVSWNDIINRPTEFNPTLHRHLIDDLYGFEAVVDYLERIKRALTLSQASLIIDIVKALLSGFECGELPKVLPSDRLVQYDALLYFLSRRKILADIWVDTKYCKWFKGDSTVIQVDTSGYPVNTTLYWEFYKPDLPIGLFTRTSGEIKTNGGIVEIQLYVPAKDNVIDDPIYIGVKENTSQDEYTAVTYKLDIVEHIRTDEAAPYLVSRNLDEVVAPVEIINYASNDETRIYYVMAYY